MIFNVKEEDNQAHRIIMICLVLAKLDRVLGPALKTKSLEVRKFEFLGGKQ